MAEVDMRRELATAAKWWADQLPQPTAALAAQVGAQPGDQMANPMAQGLFGLLAEKEAATVTPEAIAAFRSALEGVLRENLVRHDGTPWPEKYNGMGFGSDYGPDVELGDALARAGLNSRSMTLLPMKTVMWIGPGSVRVAAGYGAGIENVPLVDG